MPVALVVEAPVRPGRDLGADPVDDGLHLIAVEPDRLAQLDLALGREGRGRHGNAQTGQMTHHPGPVDTQTPQQLGGGAPGLPQQGEQDVLGRHGAVRQGGREPLGQPVQLVVRRGIGQEAGDAGRLVPARPDLVEQPLGGQSLGFEGLAGRRVTVQAGDGDEEQVVSGDGPPQVAGEIDHRPPQVAGHVPPLPEDRLHATSSPDRPARPPQRRSGDARRHAESGRGATALCSVFRHTAGGEGGDDRRAGGGG